MKTTHIRFISNSLFLYLAIILCVSLFGHSTSAFQIAKRGGTTWVGLQTGKSFQLKEYEITEEINPSTLIRKDYIKRRTDKRPILFYTHYRAIETTLGHRGHHLLINDNEASKSNKVMIVNLDNKEVRRIDLAAIAMYRRNASPDGRLIIVPEAHAFSPTDKQVLIKMELISISAPFDEKALSNRLKKFYKQWWYVVDRSDGQVKREHRTSKLPKDWWK